MLTQIFIRDLATIEELHLSFQQGSTMITGETGAGKSVFIEAIQLALGGRASSNIIRASKDKADITLCFDISQFPEVTQLLKDNDFYQDNDECIIRRVVTADGRSRSYVNGAPTTLPFIKELGELLFHLHSQHEQQVLLKAETQRYMLDRYGAHLALAEQVRLTAEKWKTVSAQINDLQNQSADRVARCEYLRYQLDELEALKLAAGEWESLESEHHRMTHAEDLLRHIQQSLMLISDADSKNILSYLNDLRKTLESVQPMETKSADWLQAIDNALIQMNDLESELNSYLETTELDPEKLQQLDERISQIYNCARKHKIQPGELFSLHERLSVEYSGLQHSDENLRVLMAEQSQIAADYQKLAADLSSKRKKAAVKLEKEITGTIRSLSLPHGEFKISLESDVQAMSAHGQEKIVFLIKTNPDQIPQPLAKVISGGELSRLSLAAHLALANHTSIPTLVFDEIDTGLSGATAEKIGKLLRRLGETYQVFCITHQPQVAACGHHHVLVEKYFVDNSTYTRLRELNAAEKTSEIARMLGGEKITKKTLAHAEELLQT